MAFEEYKDIIATTGSVTTILQYLTGILICKTVVKRGAAGEISGFPFVAGFLSCSLWLKYGTMLDDSAMICVNAFGTILQASYVIVYYFYAHPKLSYQKQIVVALSILGMAMIYPSYEEDFEIAKYWIGLLCCCLTVAFCAAPLTQLGYVLRSRSTESLPFSMILATFIVTAQWFLYGCAIHDPFVQVPNFVGALLAAVQLSLFGCFDSTTSKLPSSSSS